MLIASRMKRFSVPPTGANATRFVAFSAGLLGPLCLVATLLFGGMRALSQELARDSPPIQADEIGERVYVYRNNNDPVGFIPSGWMPDGRGIAQNTAVKESPHSAPDHLRLHCRLSEKPFVGVYFLHEGQWEPEHVFNLQEKLGVRPGDGVKCRLWARSDDQAQVQFKVGGVVKGKVTDSIRIPVSTPFIRLSRTWTLYELNLDGKDVSSIVGAFMWVADRVHNSDGTKGLDVAFDLDDVYFVKTRSGPTAAASGRNLEEARQRFLEKMRTLRWIAFSPSTFNPNSKTPLLKADVEADLRALREAGFTGLVTYSCVPARATKASETSDVVGPDEFASLARISGFKGFVAGVWDPSSEKEIEAAKKLALSHLVDAVVVGNEGLGERYEWEKLRAVMHDIRVSCAIPVSTSEQINDYGFEELRDPRSVDWIFPNVHPVFQNTEDPKKAAEWTIFMIHELRKLDGDKADKLPLMVKETGWPSQGMTYHNELNQELFWAHFDQLARESLIPYVFFEAFDQPWKHEDVLGKNIGPHWGLFTADRKAKIVAGKNSAAKP
jgi:exo-beta-1,3-glucanase (GH17 family)